MIEAEEREAVRRMTATRPRLRHGRVVFCLVCTDPIYYPMEYRNAGGALVAHELCYKAIATRYPDLQDKTEEVQTT